jgi:acyl dehydratase
MARRNAAESSSWAFDDAAVGSTIQHRGGRTIGADEHVWLAWITNNASDLHGNVDAASRTEFGQAVVLGALTVAIVIGLAEPAEWPAKDVARHRATGWRSIRLTGLVVPGDTLWAESVILGAAPFADGVGGLVRRLIVGRTQAGAEVARVEEERAVPTWAASGTT